MRSTTILPKAPTSIVRTSYIHRKQSCWKASPLQLRVGLTMLLAILCQRQLLAQHSDVYLYGNGGQLATFTGSGSLERVFVRRFDFFGHPFGNTSLPRVFFADDPGFEANFSPPAGLTALPGSQVLSISFVPFSLPNGTQGNVAHWGATDSNVDFQSLPNGYSISIEDGAGNSSFRLEGDMSSQTDLVVAPMTPGAGIHQHVEWLLEDNDGNPNSDPMSGIYLMAASLQIEGLDASEPILIGLTSPSVTTVNQDAAINWLRTNLDSISFSGNGLVGDFNGDGRLAVDDIDQLVTAVATQSTNLEFDLTGDGAINLMDVDRWRVVAGNENLPGGIPYPAGDANLDGVTDVADFQVWQDNRFTVSSLWSAGDFTADGAIDVSDFHIWNANKFGATVTAVPEPSLHGLFTVMLVGLLAACRRR